MTRRPAPPDGCVEVWLLDGANAPAGFDRIGLVPEEEARAARMATPALRERTRLRRRFARHVLSAYLGLPPEAVPLRIAPGGKPMVPKEAGLRFSLSHTGDISVLAVGGTELGIDVERGKSFDRLDDVMTFSCSPRELAEIGTAPDPTAAFLERWVVKEAILKCRGTGLVEDLGSIDPGPVSRKAASWSGLVLLSLSPPSTIAPQTVLHIALAVAGEVNRIVWPQVGD